MNAAATLKHWESLCEGGATNVLRIGTTSYSWDAHPREQKNGALLGRVWAQETGRNPTDIGGYKIERDGSISSIPEPLAAVLVRAPAPEARPSPFDMADIEEAA